MTFAECLKQRVKAEIIHYRNKPAAASHAIVWLMCREAYAHGYVKGAEGGKAFPNDINVGTLEEGHWFAGYDFADEIELPPEEEEEDAA